jgi:hypothetical protein
LAELAKAAKVGLSSQAFLPPNIGMALDAVGVAWRMYS